MIIMIKGSWYKVPEVILTDKGLTLADACVFAHIAQECQQSSKALAASEIAAETGYSVRTVKTAVQRLSDRHYIAVEHRRGSSSVYRQLLVPPAKTSAPRGAQKRSSSNVDIEKYKIVINQGLDCFDGKEEQTG